MGKLYDLDDFRPGEYLFCALALCLNGHWDDTNLCWEFCLHRWVAGVPKDTSLFKLECPECGGHDSFATVLPSEYMEHFGVES